MPNLPATNFDDAVANIPVTPDTAGFGEQGYALTYAPPSRAAHLLWNYGGLLPLGAAAAGLWYLNRARKNRKKQNPDDLLPQEKTAAPDIKKIIENIRWHLPKIRPVDTVAGLLAGGGAGALYDIIRGRDAHGKRRTGRRVLTGALAGAGLSNLVGDRFRRYLSNVKLPVGYDSVNEIKPTWSKVWRAGILDRRAENLERAAKKRFGVDARIELVRRQFGLPVNEPDNPWFQKTPEGYYTLNEQSPDYARRLRQIYGATPGNMPSNFTYDPQKWLQRLNQSTSPLRRAGDQGFFGGGPVFGMMQVPFARRPDGGLDGMVLDRWDLTHTPDERKWFLSNWRRALTDKKWAEKPYRPEHSYRPENAYNAASQTNKQMIKQLAGRWVWDNILSDELPWIGQKFTFQPNQRPETQWQKVWGGRSPNLLQFLKDDNTPATPAMNWQEIKDWQKKWE